MSLYATLHTTPTNSCHEHEMLYITRGASATLSYSLFNKVFEYSDIEQFTIILKQDRTFYGYSMFDLSGDEKKLNPHFYLDDTTDYAAIIFNLDSQETIQFKPNVDIEYEVVIKLDTDRFASLGGKDSTIIEPQHPIAVIDSLYSYIGGI